MFVVDYLVHFIPVVSSSNTSVTVYVNVNCLSERKKEVTYLLTFGLFSINSKILSFQDRDSQKGLDSAVDNFLRSAGTFQYIHENFTNAPSMDLQA